MSHYKKENTTLATTVSKQPSQIVFDRKNQKYRFNKDAESNIHKDDIFKHLHLLSEHKINAGDYFYGTSLGVERCTQNIDGLLYYGDGKKDLYYYEGMSKKIIASTDPTLDVLPIWDNFINAYCTVQGRYHKCSIQVRMVQECFAETQRDKCFRGSCHCTYTRQILLNDQGFIHINPYSELSSLMEKNSQIQREVVILVSNAFNRKNVGRGKNNEYNENELMQWLESNM